jgi:hypothetical protein
MEVTSTETIKEIASAIDLREPYFETPIGCLTEEDLRADCKSPREIDPYEHYYCESRGTFRTPGALVLKLLKPGIIKIHNENKSFPLSRLINYNLGYRSTKESPIYINEDLILQIQIKYSFRNNQGTPVKLVCMVEFVRASDRKVVLQAQSDFVTFKPTDPATNPAV